MMRICEVAIAGQRGWFVAKDRIARNCRRITVECQFSAQVLLISHPFLPH